MAPLISIKIASYNHARFIGQTIRSVLDQTYTNFELIIVDDCSSDNSVEIIQSFDDPRITLLVSDANMGAAATSLRAKPLLRGEYFCSLDSDDYFHPEKLERQLGLMLAEPEIDVLGTFIHEVDAQGCVIADTAAVDWFNQGMDFNLPESWIWRNHLCHSSVLMKRTIHDRLWMYESGLPFTNDWNNWIRFLANGVRFGMLPEKLTYYRMHGDNVTHKNPRRRFWEYAYISSTVLHPFLKSTKKPGLITENLLGFLRHPCCPTDWARRCFLLQVLLHDECMDLGNGFEGGGAREFKCEASSMRQLSLDSALDAERYLWTALDAWRTDVDRELAEWQRLAREWQRVAAERESLICLTVLPRILRFMFRIFGIKK